MSISRYVKPNGVSHERYPTELAKEFDLPAVVDTPLKRPFQALVESLNVHPAMENLQTGLNPADLVDVWNDEGALDNDLADITTGRWIRSDMQDDKYVDNEFACNEMEDRVERTGYAWLNECLDDSETNVNQLSMALDDVSDWLRSAMADSRERAMPPSQPKLQEFVRTAPQ